MVALLLVAVSVGLDNLGASTAIGVPGVDRSLRIRVALFFGVFEATMPIVGLLLGHSLARDLGSASKPLGGTLLGLVGVYVIVSELVGNAQATKAPALRPRAAQTDSAASRPGKTALEIAIE